MDEFALSTEIWVNSDVVRDEFLQHGYAPQKVRMVPLGVDTDQFREMAARVRGPSEKLRLLFVGRVCRRKGVDILLDALRLGPEYFELTMVGTKDEEFWKTLNTTGISTTYLGPLGGDALHTQYHHADVLVLPSRSDAFGLVALEAIASGRPVITTDACGVARVVAEYGCGIVIPAESRVELFGALVQLLDNGSRLTMSRATSGATRDHSWDRYQTRVARIYLDEILRWRSSEHSDEQPESSGTGV